MDANDLPDRPRPGLIERRRVIFLASANPMVDPPWTAIAAIVVAFAAGAVAVWSAQFTERVKQRDRRRAVYSDAYKAALGWQELLYRVRRRSKDPEQVRDLVAQFHAFQEKITYFEGWLGTESAALGRSYARLLRRVKSETEDLIRHAWRTPGRDVDEDQPEDERHPDIGRECEHFLSDVRDHLSPWPWQRMMVNHRNPQNKERAATK
jgi:hypothetical protein